MPTLNEKLELGAALFTQPRDLGERRVYGTATAASSDGSVSVDVGGETVTIPTVGAVAQGDEVVIQVQNGHPVAIGVRGWGDAIQSQVDETASYVWLDQYGHLRVTPLPKEQQPTTGVTIDSNSVDIISDSYSTSVSDDGMTIYDEEARQVAQLCTGTWSQGAIIKGRNGVWLSSYSNDFDTPLIEPVELYIAPAVQQDAEIVKLQRAGVAYFKAYSDSVAYGGPTSERVYPVATSSHLGPVKVGDGLSVDAGGTLSWDGMTILSYGHSTWQDFIDAYNANRVVYCRASSNSNPGTGAQTRMAFMAYVNASPPTNVEFQYYRSVSSHSATQQGDQVYIYKLTSAGTWTVTVREASVQVVADTGLTRAYASNNLTIGLDDTGWTELVAPTSTNGAVWYRRVGKTCTVLADGTYKTSTTSGWVTLATLPTDCRPTSTPGTMRFSWYDHATGAYRRGQVTSGGAVALNQTGTQDAAEFCFSFPIA